MKLTKNTCYYVKVEGLTMIEKLNLLKKIKKIFGDDIKWGGTAGGDISVYSEFLDHKYDIYFVIYYCHTVYFDGLNIIMRPYILPYGKNVIPLKFNNLKNKLK